MRSEIEQYFMDVVNEGGSMESFDFGSDGYVDCVEVVELDSDDRLRFPEDFAPRDTYAMVSFDNLGFVYVEGIDADRLEQLRADYADFYAEVA